MRMYLWVPFAERNKVKALGGRWNPDLRRWYTTSNFAAFANWIAPEITELPNEDRRFGGNALFVDLIPTSCWFSNVRSAVSTIDWERLRHFVYSRADYCCEICGVRAPQELDAHERWAYDEETRVQSLRRLLALCKACHRSTHFGLATVRGEETEAFTHLMTVNRWDVDSADDHINDAYKTWNHRNTFSWALDLSILDAVGVTYQHHQRGARVPGIIE